MQQKYYKLIARKCQGKRGGQGRDVERGGGVCYITCNLGPGTAEGERESQTTICADKLWANCLAFAMCVCVCVCVLLLCVSGVCVCQLCVCECVCLLTRMRWVPQLALKIITLADLLSVARPKRKCSPLPPSSIYPISPLVTCLLPSAGCCKWAATLRLQRRHIVTAPPPKPAAISWACDIAVWSRDWQEKEKRRRALRKGRKLETKERQTG